MSAPLDYRPPAEQLVETMRRIYRFRMTTTSGGNLSIRDEDGVIWITPARVDKGNLRADDIVAVHPDGRRVGKHPPSSEFPFHKKIYDARPGLRAIVHAHPVALVAFSMCKQTPDTNVFAKAARVCGEVAFSPYRLPGSEALGDVIAEGFAGGANCVMLENHGVVVGGGSLHGAFKRFETLEFAARSIIRARTLGGARPLTAEQVQSARGDVGWPAYDPEPPRTAERQTRSDLAGFVRRGYEQGLMTSTQGSFSARLDDDAFVINRTNVDRQSLVSGDLCRIDCGRCEAAAAPSRAATLHRAIYQRHPEITAVVNATPVNATAFALSGVELDSRTIPESFVFLRQVQSIPHETVFRDPARIAELMSPANPIALLENDSVLVLGTTVLDAFDRLEVLESTADAIVSATQLGEISPMDDGVIEELGVAFGL
ncbi:MAG: class II aldolase/adducin family protein [Planctomycetota bacterium]